MENDYFVLIVNYNYGIDSVHESSLLSVTEHN